MAPPHQDPLPLSDLDEPRGWRLDARTRQVGRQGLARARAALSVAARRAARRDAAARDASTGHRPG